MVAGPGSDSLYGGEGDDRYLIDDRVFLIIDTQGSTYSARVSVDFVKLPADIELIEYAPGVRALPYWIDALLPTDAAGSQFATLLGTTRQFTYGFPTALPAYNSSPDDGTGFAAFNEAQKAFARQALAVVATVAGVEFVESVSLSMPNAIALANNRQLDSAGYAYTPSASFIGSDLFLDVDTASNLAPAEGDYSALTLIHELGHALGLKHPFAGEAGAVNEGPYLPASEDDTAWTVMSYQDHPEQYYLRFSPLDIAALQYLYGPAATARAGNDAYPVSAAAPNFIWDGAGLDTLDLSALAQGATVYLTPGHWGFVGSAPAAQITAPGQITVNFGSVIENLSGTTGTDRLYGNDADNRIEG
ncbi:MAG: M10 family metallopeptidase, partial [Burkholderiales bacterium]|nr:M10 family metallopeptidase [Burkholderiales bacterium]